MVAACLSSDIIGTNGSVLLNGPLGTNPNDILFMVQRFWYKEMRLKCRLHNAVCKNRRFVQITNHWCAKKKTMLTRSPWDIIVYRTLLGLRKQITGFIALYCLSYGRVNNNFMTFAIIIRNDSEFIACNHQITSANDGHGIRQTRSYITKNTYKYG